MIIEQYADGFFYTSDSMFLYDFYRMFGGDGKVLDIGCGCGILGLLIARDYESDVVCLDKDPDNTALAQRNAANNTLERLTTVTTDLAHYKAERFFDAIISNPPFYPSSTTKSTNPKLAQARYDEHLPLDVLIQKSNKLLKERGQFIFCYEPKKLGEILTYLNTTPLRPTHIRFVHPTPSKEASLVMIRCLRLSKQALSILPPMVAMEGGVSTPEALKIFRQAATTSQKCCR